VAGGSKTPVGGCKRGPGVSKWGAGARKPVCVGVNVAGGCKHVAGGSRMDAGGCKRVLVGGVSHKTGGDIYIKTYLGPNDARPASFGPDVVVAPSIP
jgi:hypothetical protein